VKFIIPDAEIRNIQGEFYIIMNDGILPKLSVNNAYKEVLNTNADENTTEYVKEKLNKAISIVKSIEQRRSTLYKVLEKIVEKQKDFLLKGINYIKPMTLKEISEDIKMHESTVSRAIKDKYILTSFGTIKIKDLFVSKLSVGKNDEDVAVTIIKKKIKDMIDNENKKKPLSDQVICDNLNDEKINISRRTVAKYREELGIQSSSKRKRI
jgi:RNA polymerase sigma-54 factor